VSALGCPDVSARPAASSTSVVCGPAHNDVAADVRPRCHAISSRGPQGVDFLERLARSPLGLWLPVLSRRALPQAPGCGRRSRPDLLVVHQTLSRHRGLGQEPQPLHEETSFMSEDLQSQERAESTVPRMPF
jgi:hypothetical protein